MRTKSKAPAQRDDEALPPSGHPPPACVAGPIEIDPNHVVLTATDFGLPHPALVTSAGSSVSTRALLRTRSADVGRSQQADAYSLSREHERIR
jgi:hypothetical protein